MRTDQQGNCPGVEQWPCYSRSCLTHPGRVGESLGSDKGMVEVVLKDDVPSPSWHAAIVIAVRFLSVQASNRAGYTFLPSTLGRKRT